MRIIPVTLIAIITGIFGIMVFNPCGLGVRMFDGQKPPYRWVQEDVSHNTAGTVKELYVGTNGAVCASVYRYGDAPFTVYGFGFNKERVDRQGAEYVAEHECR